MTSGVFRTCPIDQIIVNREERQRHDIKDNEGLLDSIHRLGLIHPIVISRDYVLVAGERRLDACRQLGWTDISVQFIDEMDQWTLKTVELEENIKRQNLSWLDESRAIVELDRLYRERATENIEAWTENDTATVAGLSQQTISDHRATIEAVNKTPELAAEKSRSTVLTFHRSQTKREKDSPQYGDYTGERYNNHIQHCSFLDWVRTYDGPKFNLIHCDFPYGIGFDKMGDQAGPKLERYNDDFEAYKKLLFCLSAGLDIFTEESAHLIFWFSMQSYEFTYEHLSKQCGFNVNPFPLVWVKSDNSGILPDPSRGPRRIYETAFLASRGDRPIVRAKSNAVALPTTKIIHPHEKPQEVLEYFFEMLVDKNTSLFDPTCGGGSALRAARKLGSPRTFGLEIDENYVVAGNQELMK